MSAQSKTASIAPSRTQTIEWPTVALLAACYGVWAAATLNSGPIGPVAAAALVALCTAQHASLQHEAIHGHPTRSAWLNEALVFPAIGLALPYGRFRDQHLAHHHDPKLTDPYDDPESNYLDPAVWERLPAFARALLRANNTLLGRMALGPALSLGLFYAAEWRALRVNEPGARRAWAMHGAALAPVVLWLAFVADISPTAYLIGVYCGVSLLKIRTFLEHRAHEKAPGRTVIIEDRGPLALLFLNNNLHAVHHAHPKLAWYRLPAAYAERRAQYLARNHGYRYRSYGDVFARHFLRAKDPVPHPMYRGRSVDL